MGGVQSWARAAADGVPTRMGRTDRRGLWYREPGGPWHLKSQRPLPSALLRSIARSRPQSRAVRCASSVVVTTTRSRWAPGGVADVLVGPAASRAEIRPAPGLCRRCAASSPTAYARRTVRVAVPSRRRGEYDGELRDGAHRVEGAGHGSTLERPWPTSLAASVVALDAGGPDRARAGSQPSGSSRARGCGRGRRSRPRLPPPCCAVDVDASGRPSLASVERVTATKPVWRPTARADNVRGSLVRAAQVPTAPMVLVRRHRHDRGDLGRGRPGASVRRFDRRRRRGDGATVR